MCVQGGGVRHWWWRAVDGHGDVLDMLLQEHRGTEAATSRVMRLLGNDDVLEVMHTERVWSRATVK